jgi:hypothetical protein
MNKWHIVVRREWDAEGKDGTTFKLAFDGMSVSLLTAAEFAASMNRIPASCGAYFPVPAPFAGEI